MNGNRQGTAQAGADTIIRNAKVITCDPAFTIADALAIRDGRIAAIGRGDDMAPLAGPATRTIDAGGSSVMPGLIDGHAHMDREGLKQVFPSLAECRSVADILDRIADLAKDRAAGEWIVTMPIGVPPYYWDVPDILEEKRFPTRWELDRAAPDNPVYIRPIWGYWRHTLPISSVANTRALLEGGIGPDMEPKPPATVIFETDPESGEINGVIQEYSYMPIVELAWLKTMPRFDHGDRVAGLKRAMFAYNAFGTTGVLEEHGCAEELIVAWQAVHDQGAQTVRGSLIYSPSWPLSGMADGGSEALSALAGRIGGRGSGDDWLRVEGLYTEFGIEPENVLRARAAPYTGWAGFNYDCGVPCEKMKDFMIEAAKNDIRISTIWMEHLDLYREVDKVVPLAGRRWILGHLRCADERQIATIRDLGLVMTSHTNRYVYKAGHLVRDEIGRAVENTIAPLKSLGEAGVHVALATDNVPVSLFYPVWQAVTRYNMYSKDAIAPDQALTREEALKAATIEGAFLTFDEDVKGSIEVGKLADLAILTDDPLTCPADNIKDISAETTIVGGKVVYSRGTEEAETET